MTIGRTNVVVAAITALGLVYGQALSWRFNFPLGASPLPELKMLASCTVFVVAPMFLWVLYRERPDSPFAHVQVFAERHHIKARAMAAVLPLLCISQFIATFGAIKSGIPAITRYTWDPWLADMDEAIFGGRAAWELLQPWLGHPWISWALNAAYHLWIGVFYAAVLWFAIWVERPVLRAHFFVAFLLCWLLLGSVAAVLMPSVGPCFYAEFYQSDRFAGLMDYLHQADKVAPLAVLNVQAKLLAWYHSGRAGLGAGISAMPSMHVSIATLLALAAWRVSRLWGWAATAFAGSIILGSVHLGYHYAVDGIASLIATPVIWWAAGQLVQLAQPRAAFTKPAPA